MENKVLLPNSIPRAQKIDWSMSKPGYEWMYLYCASCGADGGRVLKNEIPNKEEFAFYLCDPCAEKFGQIDGCYMVPDEAFFAKVRAAQQEKFGKILNQQESVVVLDDAESFLNKLIRDRRSFVASE